MEDDPFAFMRGEAAQEKTHTGMAGHQYAIAVTVDLIDVSDPIEKVNAEVLGKAIDLNAELGSRVAAIALVSRKHTALLDPFQHYKCDHLFRVDVNDAGDTGLLVQKLSAWAGQEKPDIWFFPSTVLGYKLAARLAMRLKTGCVSGVTELGIDVSNRTLEMTHLTFDKKMKRTWTIKERRPQICIPSPGIFSVAETDKNYKAEQSFL